MLKFVNSLFIGTYVTILIYCAKKCKNIDTPAQFVKSFLNAFLILQSGGPNFYFTRFTGKYAGKIVNIITSVIIHSSPRALNFSRCPQAVQILPEIARTTKKKC
jgi:hypothetical protein